MTITRIAAPEGVAPSGRYSHVASGTGRFIAVAGQVPLDENNELVGAGDPEAQARQVFLNLSRCLAAAGASFEDVIKLNYYFTAPEVLLAARTAREEAMGDLQPASTAVQVVALFKPDFVLEVEAYAVVPA